MKTYREVEVSLHAFLIYVVDKVDWSDSLGKNHWYPLDRRLGEPQNQAGCFGEEANLPPLQGSESWFLGPPVRSWKVPKFTKTRSYTKSVVRVTLSLSPRVKYSANSKLYSHKFQERWYLEHPKRRWRDITCSEWGTATLSFEFGTEQSRGTSWRASWTCFRPHN
jgi:hypothetical protein